ncbi:hypothetical protein PybrP1_008097 [[Pythium] brassicae (nom. inval.)]|nr:hypothetical protein PybrP1_008097 [[Pythium] brassicae (nom. inval.)]
MQPSHLAPSVTPRPLKAGANGPGKPLGSPASRAGRTYTPSVSPIKTTPRNGANPFSLGEASKANDLLGLRPPEGAPSPASGELQMRKKPIILSGDARNLDSNFAIAMSRVQVSRAHVAATLARYAIAVSSDEAQSLLYEYEENNDAGLSYDAFVDDLVQVLRRTALNKAGTSRTLIKKVRLPRHLEKLGAMHAHVAHELQTLLGEKLRVSWATVRDTFRAADKERRGHLPKSVFAALCLELQVPVPNAVLEGLVLRADPRAEGVVDYNDFLAYFGVDFQHSDPNSVSSSLVFERGVIAGKGAVYGIGNPTVSSGAVSNTLSSPGVSSALGGGKKKRSGSSSPAPAPAAATERQQDLLALEQLRIALNEKLAARYADVKKAFVALDKDGNGRMSAAEFARVLESFNLVVSRDELDALMAQLDSNDDGVVDYTEFFARFGEALKPTIGTLKKQLQENSSLVFTGHKDVKGANKSRLALSSPGNELKEAFSRLSDDIWRAVYVELEMADPRKTGLVPSAELLRVLAKYLGELPARNFSVLFRACGSHVNQFMNYRTLVKSYRPSALDSVEFYRQDRHALAAKAYCKSPTESLVMVWSVRVQRAQLTPAEWQALKETVWKADARRQGRILAAEFKPILHRFLRLSDDQVAFLCFFYEDKNLSSDHVLIRYSSFLTDYEDPGLEDADGPSAKQPRGVGARARPEGKGRPRLPYEASPSSGSSGSGPVAFTDADRMEREQEEKRLRDFFAVNVRALEALVSREDPDKRGFVTLDTFVRLCKEVNGGRWKDSAASTALFSKYMAQNQLLYYRAFLLDFDQKAGLQTQALVLQDDDDDDDGVDQYGGDQMLGGAALTIGVHPATSALRHQLTSNMRRQRAAYKVFQRMDPGKSGILGYPELRRALERLDIVVDDAAARELFAHFEDEDDEGNRVLGRVKYLQFLHAHGGRDPDKALDGMSDLSSNCSYYSAISISPRPVVRGSSTHSPRPLITTRDYVAAANAVSNAIEKPRNGGGGGSSMNTGAAAAAAVERKIKEQLEAQGKTKWKQVARAFQQIDGDRRGSVATGSFRKVLEEFGVLLDQEELVRLQLKYDIEQNGRIHYQEYLRHLTNSMSDLGGGSGAGATTELLPSLSGIAASPRKSAPLSGITDTAPYGLNGISETLRQGVRAKWKAIYSSFKTLDKQNLGRVSSVHFRQLLEWYALPVSDEMFLNLLRQFDHAEDGCVDYNKFMRTCFGG